MVQPALVADTLSITTLRSTRWATFAAICATVSACAGIALATSPRPRTAIAKPRPERNISPERALKTERKCMRTPLVGFGLMVKPFFCLSL